MNVFNHPDLTEYVADERDDIDAELICYFDDYTMSLWHVYVNGGEIFNLLSDTVIQSLEREYSAYVRKCRDEYFDDSKLEQA
jgi:hypothetical protein